MCFVVDGSRRRVQVPQPRGAAGGREQSDESAPTVHAARIRRGVVGRWLVGLVGRWLVGRWLVDRGRADLGGGLDHGDLGRCGRGNLGRCGRARVTLGRHGLCAQCLLELCFVLAALALGPLATKPCELEQLPR